MIEIDINDFTQEKECIFKGERYSVRDNGAVYRHQRTGKRKRPTDNKWTFGKENSANPYLHISNVRVHRIVATAFHGEPPDQKYVVDHKDSNCKNNRPENLRWLTRLENTLKNPVTRKKIEYLCGSIEVFLKNPSILNELQGNPNFKWMRTVTPEEAQNCMKRMSVWAKTSNKPKSSERKHSNKSSFAKRVFKPLQKWEVGLGREPGLKLALTPGCAQYMWGVDVYFPCCPQEFGADPINDYFQNLKTGTTLACNDCEKSSFKLTILKSVILKEKSSILVMSEKTDCKWLNIGIKFHEKSKHFIHYILDSYSIKTEADKAFLTKIKLKDFGSSGYDGFSKLYDIT